MNNPDNSPYPPGPAQPPEPFPPARPSRPVLRPPVRVPSLTYALIAVTVLVYLIQIATQNLLGYDLPAALGMKVNNLIIQGQFWRLITPVFLHGSILHIAFNMYALYVIGRDLEMSYGHLRYLLLYFVGGLAGNVFSFLLSSAPSLGASTAIFGLLAAEAVFVYQNRELFGNRARSILTNIIVIMAINLVLGLSPGIDNWGHLGGLLGGVAFAWFAGPVLRVRADMSGYRLENERGIQSAWLATAVEITVLAALVLQRVAFK